MIPINVATGDDLAALANRTLTERLSHHTPRCCSNNRGAELFCDSDGEGSFPIFNEDLKEVVIALDCYFGDLFDWHRDYFLWPINRNSRDLAADKGI